MRKCYHPVLLSNLFQINYLSMDNPVAIAASIAGGTTALLQD